MELKIDLYKETKKSLFRVIGGVLFLLVAIAGFIVISYKENLIPLMWFFYVIFALNGIFHIVEGLGYRFESLFGKAYVWITR